MLKKNICKYRLDCERCSYYRFLCRFAVSNTDSSDEEEIFSKSKQTSKYVAKQSTELHQAHQAPPLSAKSPNMSHADWAMENLSRSPGWKLFLLHDYNINPESLFSLVFREMMEKHPEALDEMNDVMTKIGHKWEGNQYRGSRASAAQLNNPEPVYDQDLLYPSSDSSLTEPIYSSRHQALAPPAPPIPPHAHRKRSHHAHRRPGRNSQGRGYKVKMCYVM